MKQETSVPISFFNLEKAHQTKDIRALLQPHLSFRAYVKFKTSQEYGKGSQCHFYGNEHRCTYNQCLHQKVPNVVLNKQFGYNDLITMIETGKFMKGRYISAKIYSKSNPDVMLFDVLHREYSKGKLVTSTVNDPVFEPPQVIVNSIDHEGTIKEVKYSMFKLFDYTIERGRLVLTERTNEQL